VAIFNTHHHSDHVGNQQLLQRFEHVKVYGERIGEEFQEFRCFLKAITSTLQIAKLKSYSGHTRAHIAYYFAPESE